MNGIQPEANPNPAPMENSSNNNPPMADRNPVDIDQLKLLCLSRQSLETIERAHPQFGAMRSVLLGCLVRVNVQGEYLVGLNFIYIYLNE